MNCNVTSLPLGMPIKNNSRKYHTFVRCNRKLSKKLSKEKVKHLSFTRRICLLKAGIFAVSLFNLSFLKIQNRIKKKLRKYKHIVRRPRSKGEKDSKGKMGYYL